MEVLEKLLLAMQDNQSPHGNLDELRALFLKALEDRRLEPLYAQLREAWRLLEQESPSAHTTTTTTTMTDDDVGDTDASGTTGCGVFLPCSVLPARIGSLWGMQSSKVCSALVVVLVSYLLGGGARILGCTVRGRGVSAPLSVPLCRGGSVAAHLALWSPWNWKEHFGKGCRSTRVWRG